MLDLAGSLAPISFFHVHVLSSPHSDDAHRARVAHEVVMDQGLSGLLTLWACQEFFPPTEHFDGEMTPATRWWLAPGNAFSKRLQQALAHLPVESAVQLLGQTLLALQPPSNAQDPYVPEDRREWSRTDAQTVRAMALTFFPQHPSMQEPTCPLYLRTYDHGDTNVGLDEYDDLKSYPVHAAPLHAFRHDICALHYLTRAHASDVVGWDQLDDHQIKALERTLADWDMYEEMGMTPEESYHVAKQRTQPTVDIFPDVFALDNPR